MHTGKSLCGILETINSPNQEELQEIYTLASDESMTRLESEETMRSIEIIEFLT